MNTDKLAWRETWEVFFSQCWIWIPKLGWRRGVQLATRNARYARARGW